MTHPINYQNITNEAIQLEILAFSSRQYISELENIHPLNDDKIRVSELSIQVTDYEYWLIDTVSKGLISIAIQIRILQDTYGFKIEDNPDYSADLEAFKKFANIAVVCEGEIKLSIRECCNKVIHATDLEFLFDTNDSKIQYWNGYCILKGIFCQKEWCMKLNVGYFCSAIKAYISIIKHL